MRGLPDGTLLHLRDTYPLETAWAPRYVGDELRQVRAAAWQARLAALRATADARAAAQRGDHHQADKKRELAASYQALQDAYRQREDVFAAVMADRADWDAATRHQRHLAVAADAELRRRHPAQHYPPLRSAEPGPLTQDQRDQLTLTPGQQTQETVQWITELAAQHHVFAEQLADRQSLMTPRRRPQLRRPRPGVPALARTRQGRHPPATQARDPAIPADTPARPRPGPGHGSRGLTSTP